MEQEQIRKAIKELTKIQEQNEKLSTMKELYQSKAEELKLISDKILDICKDLDPFAHSKKRKKYFGRTRRQEMMNEILTSLRSGMFITRDFISTRYPDFPEAKYFSIFAELKKVDGVKWNMDGRKIRFYI